MSGSHRRHSTLRACARSRIARWLRGVPKCSPASGATNVAIILPGAGEASARGIAERAVAAIAEPFVALGHRTTVGGLTFHFTPTSSSWLNAAEGFFAILTRRRLQNGVFRSVVDLRAAINRFIDEHNRTPKPFIWKAIRASGPHSLALPSWEGACAKASHAQIIDTLSAKIVICDSVHREWRSRWRR